MKRCIRMLCSVMALVCLVVSCTLPASAGTLLDFIKMKQKDAGDPEIVQFVSSQYSSVFAVLYDDGTVGIGGIVSDEDEENLLDDYVPATKWQNVKKLYLNVNTLVGLCEDGTVCSVSPNWGDGFVPLNTKNLKNVVDVAFMEPDSRFFFLMEDGTVKHISEGDKEYASFEPFDGVYKTWKNVEKLVPYYYYDIYALFEDGTVKSMAGEDIPKNWSDIQELYVEGKFYGLKDNGTVVVYTPNPDFYPLIPNEATSLTGAQELNSVGELMFGLTDDGDLLVSGGKDWFYDEYLGSEDFSEKNWDQFHDIRQLIASNLYGIDYVIGLREDGKVVALNSHIHEYLSYLPEVEKLAVCFAQDGTSYVCGLQEDGNVVGIEVLMSGTAIVHKDDFYNWNVDDIYATKYGVLLGFHNDGSFVTTYESGDNYVEYMPPEGLSGK